MTADVAQVPRQDPSRGSHESVIDESEELFPKEGRISRETRAQKPTAKFNPREGHEDAIKDSTGEIESDFSGCSVGVSTRSSTRPSKRLKLSSSPPFKSVDQENKDDHNISSSNSGSAPTLSNGKKRKAKTKRQWESWGTKGKDAFFEALHEYGKDFDKIQSYIAAKHKRRGDQLALIKNKDQVRHFYYRTLNKISKYVPPEKDSDENDPHKKTVAEINSLICYGELRKKMCGLNEKHGKKLSELISHGNTTIRYNGRNFKIKTPACRALKKLYSASSVNSEDSEAQPSTAPSKLFVELTPHDNATWCAVQRMAKNPRLRTTVLTSKPLASILAFLSKKWPVMSCTSNKPLKICIVVPEGFYSSSKDGSSSPVQTCNHNDVGVPSSLSPGEAAVTDKDNEARAASETSGDVSSTVLDSDLIKDPSETTFANSNLNVVESMAAFSSGGDFLFSNELDNASDANPETTKSPPESGPRLSESNPDIAGSKPVHSCRNNPTYWTADNCGNVTFSSIYYKLGCPSSCKLKLQYKWQSEEAFCQQESSALKKLMDMASVEVARMKETKKTDTAVSKSSTTGSNISTYPTSRNMRIAPKTNDRLPFILPSVTTRASSTPTISELPPPLRPVPKLRKQQRKPAPIVQRTLLPRPMAPPGAVAVSFIPQPGQEVGTILASGVSTVSTATPSNVSSLQVGAASPTTVTTSGSPVPSPSSTQASPSAPPASSPQVLDTGDVLIQNNKDSPAVDQMPVEPMGCITQSSATGLAVVPPSFTTSSTVIDLGFSESADMPPSLTVDHLINSTGTLSNSDTLDSIIGLALGTALNDKEASVALVAVNEDSENLMVTSQPLSSVSPSLSMSSSTVQVEELNSGISGGPPITLTTSTLDKILDSSTSSVPASADGLFCNGTLTSTVTSSAQDHHEVSQDLVLSAVPALTSSGLTSPTNCSTDSEPQWLNGEAPDISLGSLLDKLSTSPKKQLKSASLEDLTGLGDGKPSSHFPLLSPHHLLDADTAMHAMMDESSVDFIRNFRDLASKLDGNDQASLQIASRTAGPNPGASGHAENAQGHLDTSLEERLTFKNILSRGNSGH